MFTYGLMRTMGKVLPDLPGCHLEPSAELAEWLTRWMPDDGQEQLAVVMLNVKGEIIGGQIVAVGTVDSAPLYSRDIYRHALMVPGVRTIGIAHNHPSGNTAPSMPDRKGTAGVVTAGRILDLPLVWSLVVTHLNSTWADCVERKPAISSSEDAPIKRPEEIAPESAAGPESEPPEKKAGPEAGPEKESRADSEGSALATAPTRAELVKALSSLLGTPV